MTHLPDEINIMFHFTCIQKFDNTLTKDEAKQVLRLMEQRENFHDEKIQTWINYFKASQQEIRQS